MGAFIRSTLAASARRVLRRHVPFVIAVTGSVGKSTTKEAIAAVLASPHTRVSPRNYNTQLGVPLSVLGMFRFPKTKFGWLATALKAWRYSLATDSAYPDTLILEMGADHPGNIATLVDIAQPNIGVVTAVGESHAKNFPGTKDIAKEKGTLAERLPLNGHAILNRDDEQVWEMRHRTTANVVSYGFHAEADVRALEETLTYDISSTAQNGTRVIVEVAGAQAELFVPHTLGSAPVYAALAAIAVGHVRGRSLTGSIEKLLACTPPPGRMRCIPGIRGATIIDDTYNAAPMSVTSALRTLAGIPSGKKSGKRIAILGDMLELGDISSAAHRDIGRVAAQLGVHSLVLVGDRMQDARQGAEGAGMDASSIATCTTPEEAGAFLQSKLAAEDIVLIKGSRRMHMEEATRALLADPIASASDLVSAAD